MFFFYYCFFSRDSDARLAENFQKMKGMQNAYDALIKAFTEGKEERDRLLKERDEEKVANAKLESDLEVLREALEMKNMKIRGLESVSPKGIGFSIQRAQQVCIKFLIHISHQRGGGG